MSLTVVLSDMDGTNAAPLASLGNLAGLSYGSGWGSAGFGDTSCTVALDRPILPDDTRLRIGRRFTVFDSAQPVFCGVLSDPQRGNPWQLTALGLATLAGRYIALDPSSNRPTVNPNVALIGSSSFGAPGAGSAIGRGLPWQLPGLLPTAPSVAPEQPDVASLLTAVAAALGQRWTVDPFGSVAMAADPTTASYLLMTSNTPGGRTTDDFATDLYVKYTDATTGRVTYIPAAGSPSASTPRPFGRWEQVYDDTAAGPISASTAANNGAAPLALISPDASFTGQLTVQPGDLLTTGGVPVRLASVRAGQMVTCIGVQPDPATGMTNYGTQVNLIIGEWVYDAVADTATLTPLGAVQRDLTSLLVRAATNAPS